MLRPGAKRGDRRRAAPRPVRRHRPRSKAGIHRAHEPPESADMACPHRSKRRSNRPASASAPPRRRNSRRNIGTHRSASSLSRTPDRRGRSGWTEVQWPPWSLVQAPQQHQHPRLDQRLPGERHDNEHRRRRQQADGQPRGRAATRIGGAHSSVSRDGPPADGQDHGRANRQPGPLTCDDGGSREAQACERECNGQHAACGPGEHRRCSGGHGRPAKGRLARRWSRKRNRLHSVAFPNRRAILQSVVTTESSQFSCRRPTVSPSASLRPSAL